LGEPAAITATALKAGDRLIAGPGRSRFDATSAFKAKAEWRRQSEEGG
jgi:hypothetical protein